MESKLLNKEPRYKTNNISRITKFDCTHR